MPAQFSTTWVRVDDQWVRADQIVAVRLELPAGPVPAGRWSYSIPQRLLVCTTLPTDDEGGKGRWQEAAVCERGRGEIVAGTLLDAMNTAKPQPDTARYVYPARSTEGAVLHWIASTTLPQGPALTGPTAPHAPAITGGRLLATRGT